MAFRPSLDSIASAPMGIEKRAEGLQAIQWYKEGRLLEIAEYCCYDVKITKLVHEYGRAHKQIFGANRFGSKILRTTDDRFTHQVGACERRQPPLCISYEPHPACRDPAHMPSDIEGFCAGRA